MKRRVRPAVWIIGAVILAVTVVLTVVRCSSSGEDDAHDQGDGHSHGTDSHEHIDPVRDDPAAAVQVTLAALLSYRPAQQETPFDQYQTVRENLTGDLAEVADNPPVGDGDRKTWPQNWGQWAENEDRVQAYVTPLDNNSPVSPDATEGIVRVNVRTVVIHQDSSRTPLRDYDAEVTVRHEDSQWKLDSYEITEIEY